MKTTNRVGVINQNEFTARAIMTITTQIEINRRIEIIPINESIETSTFLRRKKHSEKILSSIACLFITAGILALSIVISGLILVFGNMNSTQEHILARFDLEDLSSGMNDIKSRNFSFSTNKILIENYISSSTPPMTTNQPETSSLPLTTYLSIETSINNDISTTSTSKPNMFQFLPFRPRTKQ